ncbi:MAG: archease [Candidatus Omnitrophota bacterium]|nr:MAG: archease [Candidatus Omnitrophota bacterium]
MMEDFEFFEHTADVGVRVTGKTLNELFANSSKALFKLLVDSPLKQNKKREIQLEAQTLEELLVNWLNELLSIFFAEKFLPLEYNIRIEDNPQSKNIRGVILGEEFNPYENKINMEIKAATYHNLRVEHNRDGYTAEVIFDV